MSIFKKLFSKDKKGSTTNQLYTLPVTEIVRETNKAVTLVFDKPEQDFQFKPGQYLTLQTILDNKKVRRAYSLCNLPSEDVLKVTVKETPNGYFSKYVNNNIEVGDLFEVMPPKGNFVFSPQPSLARNIICFAGGSGITPIFSIIQSVLTNEPQSSITLFYGNRKQSDIIFQQQLQELQSKYNKLNVIHILSDEIDDFTPYHGFINADKINEFSQKYFSPTKVDAFYLCGPGEMTAVITEALHQLNVEKNKIYTELFTAPSTNEQEKLEKSSKKEICSNAAIRLTFDNQSHTINYTNPKKTILDVALDQQLKVPFSCLNGVCSSCSAKLKSGEVEMSQNFTLEQDEIENGYILTCQSYPLTNTVEIDFDDNRI